MMVSLEVLYVLCYTLDDIVEIVSDERLRRMPNEQKKQGYIACVLLRR